MNFEEKDLLAMGRDCWEDEDEVDGLRLTNGGRRRGGMDVGVVGIDSAVSRHGASSS